MTTAKSNRKNREKVLAKYGNKCAYCGITIDLSTLHVDHFVSKQSFRERSYPFRRDSFENLMPSCEHCNIIKHSKSVDGFREYIENSINRLSKESQYLIGEKFGQLMATPSPVVFYFEKAHDNG